MKKLICILLSLLICIGLCSCDIAEINSDVNAQPTETDTETASKTDVETETKAKTDTETEIKIETNTETTVEAEKETETTKIETTAVETETESETETETETETTKIETTAVETETETEAETEAETVTKIEATEVETEVETTTFVETEADTETTNEIETTAVDTETESEAEISTQTERVTDVETTELTTETEETTEATSEESSEIINRCEHNWERVENLDEYTAMDKCSVCGDTRSYVDPSTENSFVMLRYNWDGWGLSVKTIAPSNLGYAIIESLAKLEETGEFIPKISDDTIIDYAEVNYLPIKNGTVWIDCGKAGLFRLDPSMSEICRVETHLGEGVALEMTDTLKELLRQAWYYAPYDYWNGTYNNGEVTLNRVYNGDSAIEWVEIESIHIENAYHTESNKIVFKLKSSENKMVRYHFESYHSSDNLASSKSDYIELIKNEEITLEISFAGFVDTRYWISLVIDNTSINLTIE